MDAPTAGEMKRQRGLHLLLLHQRRQLANACRQSPASTAAA